MTGLSKARTRSILPSAAVALAIVVLGVAAGLLGSAVLRGDGGTTDAGGPLATELVAQCDGADPLHVAADPAVVPIVERLATRYIDDLIERQRDCIDVEVVEVASSAVVGRLTNGWDAQTHGPRPEVWIPQSTVWVELLRDQLDDPTIVEPEPSILARSPTVMAMPRPMAQAVGWPQDGLSWEQMAEMADSDQPWVEFGESEWGAFQLWLTDPRYTTLGLQTVLALDAAQGGQGAGEGDETATPLSLFRVQRLLTSIDVSTEQQLQRYAAAEDPLAAVSAFPLEEWQLWQSNQGMIDAISEAADAGDPPGNGVPLAAVYPDGDDQVAMESDYPYVLLDAPWVEPEVLQYAEEFNDYLLSGAAQEIFAQAGFRGPDNEVTELLAADMEAQTVSTVSGTASGELPDVGALASLRSSWVNVPRLSSTLFVVDVSGSMVAQVPGTGQTRLEATIDAGQEVLQIIPPASDVGLWEFSTALEGGQNSGDYRELVPVGPLNEDLDATTRKQRLIDALDGLTLENDTSLNDTVLAAYQAMQSNYTPERQHTILLLTDGRNDDDDSISHEQLITELRRLRNPEQPIEVVSIAYGEEPDIDLLGEISAEVGGEVISSPDVADLDRLIVEALSR
jgi:Ca-activated chloride channel family protein